jgi:ectoine hydroxylase-related dioxygenase (phytanoyl-CoA dioxygenase family)
MTTLSDHHATLGGREFAPGPVGLPDRRALRDDAQEVSWRRDGYAVMDGLDEGLLAELLRVAEELYSDRAEGFHSSLQSTDVEYRRQVFDTVTPLLEQVAERVFDRYEPFAASLTVKFPGESSELGCHQDWSMVDEFRFRTLNLWIPLVPTTIDNGALRVLPGSHLLLDHLRCSPMNPPRFVSEGTDLPVEQLVPLPLQLGQAVAFDLGVLHGSGPNLTDQWRPAITVAYKPVEAPLLHHFLPSPESETVEVYEVDAAFYTEFAIGERPRRPLARTCEFYGTERRKHQLLPDVFPAPDPVIPLVERPGPTIDLRDDGVWQERIAPVFRDPVLQEAFSRKGFVVVDLIDEGRLEQLRALPDAIYPGEHSGMHASNMCNEHEYRHEVYERVRPVLEPVVLEHLVDYESCMAIMLLKFAGTDSEFISHQDWNLVDESRFRSLNVWCPMVDTDTTNGAMSFLPGSHRVLGATRCDPWYPEWYQSPGWQVRYTEMETVDVRAGQAVFFDHAMVHASGPNLSGSVRPAVALVVKPTAADLLHWYRPNPDSEQLEVLSVDSDFLADFEIGDRHPYPVIDTVEFMPDRFDPEVLIERCRSVAGARTGAAVEAEPDAPAPSRSDVRARMRGRLGAARRRWSR